MFLRPICSINAEERDFDAYWCFSIAPAAANTIFHVKDIIEFPSLLSGQLRRGRRQRENSWQFSTKKNTSERENAMNNLNFQHSTSFLARNSLGFGDSDCQTCLSLAHSLTHSHLHGNWKFTFLIRNEEIFEGNSFINLKSWSEFLPIQSREMYSQIYHCEEIAATTKDSNINILRIAAIILCKIPKESVMNVYEKAYNVEAKQRNSSLAFHKPTKQSKF